MADKVWLTITGIQSGFGQEETLTLAAEGKYYHKDGVHYIFYEERTEEGYVIKNRLTVSPGLAQLRKKGTGMQESVLTFNEEHAQPCLYHSPAGPMELVSDTRKIRVRKRDDLLKVVLEYSLIMGGTPVSDYHLTLEARFQGAAE